MNESKLLLFRKRIDTIKEEDIQSLEVDIKVGDKLNSEFKLPLFIVGTALTEGIHKQGVFYPKEELEASAKDLIGKLVILNHDTKDVLKKVGRVTKAWYDAKTKGVQFEAWIEDDKIASKIYHGLIDSVSVGVRSKRIPLPDGIAVATKLKYDELSLTGNPADFNAKITVKDN